MNPDGTAKTANINVNRAKMVQNRLILYIYLETPTESEPVEFKKWFKFA
jgi:phage gp46-like protein